MNRIRVPYYKFNSTFVPSRAEMEDAPLRIKHPKQAFGLSDNTAIVFEDGKLIDVLKADQKRKVYRIKISPTGATIKIQSLRGKSHQKIDRCEQIANPFQQKNNGNTPYAAK